jgi:hypothetical protein
VTSGTADSGQCDLTMYLEIQRFVFHIQPPPVARQVPAVVYFIVMEGGGRHFDVFSGTEGSLRPLSGHTWLLMSSVWDFTV